tara:strand:- start:1903 stop:2592 length:690 start_codon:yes stop_codon:yes gene_type:complete
MLRKKYINNNYVVLIPLRKGSKRIKNKNFKKINNIPLVNYTLNVCLKIFNRKNIYFTSNDPQAFRLAKILNLNCVKRPNNICTANSSTEEAVLHFLSTCEKKKIPKNIVILQVTSPMRIAKDITECIEKFKRKKLDSIFSVFKSKSFIWSKRNKKLVSLNFNFKNRPRSQNLEYLYHENGSIYIFNSKKFLKHKNRIFGNFDFFEMDEKRSLDIDDMNDIKKLQQNLNE